MMKKLNLVFLSRSFFLLFCIMVSHTVFSQSTELKNIDEKEFTKQLLSLKKIKNKNNALVKLQELSLTKTLTQNQKVAVLLSKGKILLYLSRFEDAVQALIKAKKGVDESIEGSTDAEINTLLGVGYYYQGELALSLSSYQYALALYKAGEGLGTESRDLSIKKANLLNNMALVHDSMGNDTESMFHYQKAESLYQQHGSEQDKVDVRLNIALLHVNLKRYDIAIAMFKDVIINFESLGDGDSIAKATAGLGIAYMHSGKYEVAKNYTFEALEYFKENEYEHDVASELHNISLIYIYLLDYEKAIEYAKQSIDLSKKIGHQKAYAGGLNTLAKAYFYQGSLLLAQENIELSNQIAEKISYKDTLIDNLAISSLISSALGEYSTALVDFFAYVRYQNEVNNLLLNNQLAKLESEKLVQQVIQLKQTRKLNEFKATKASQQRSFILIVVVLILLTALSIYRRYLESTLAAELEKRVYQRTEELELATKKLQQANKVKSQFLANMSHEIRTPLTAIVGHAEAIIHDDISQEYLTNEVEIIHGNSLHLLELINDILDLSKIEADKFELEIRPQNIKDIIQELSNMFTEQAQKKGLLFSIEQQLEFPFIIHTDGRRLRQVLINLCSNAIKFTMQGSVILNIKLIDKQLAFTITDTGIGLTDEQMTQIFEMFAQADSSISRRFGGSGLGLSLSNQLAQLMGGHITVQSVFSKGSCFCFAIPFTVVLNNDSLTPYLSSKKNSLLTNEALKLTKVTGKILLAEDHDDNRRLIARLLKGVGLDVITATNGFEAIEMCLEHNPPLILLDIQMPEMDGITAFNKLRELGFQQPIYAITANAMSHEISQYLALGFTGHLKKPIERVSFINTIIQHYDDSSLFCPNEKVNKYDKGDVNLSKIEQVTKINFDDLIIDFKKGLTKEKQILALYFKDRNKVQLALAVHRISGAGQMFGFAELSQVAKELDTYLKKLDMTDTIDELEEQKKQNDYIEGLTNCLLDEISAVQSK